MTRLRIGKFCGAGEAPMGNSLTKRAAVGKDLFGKLLVLPGINNIDPTAEDRYRLCLGIHRPAMRRRIDPASHSTEYDESANRQVAGQPFRHPQPVRRGMPRADDRNPRLAQRRDLALHAQYRRRVVDLKQLGRVSRVVRNQQRGPGCLHLLQFLVGKPHRLPAGDRLRRGQRQSRRSQFGYRDAEDLFNISETFQQPFGPGGANAGSRG